MIKSIRMTAIFALVTLFAACSGDDDDNTDSNTVLPSEQTYVVFNPAFSQLPVPNDLLFAGEAAGDGTMCANGSNSAGTACEISDNPVLEGINALDGNSLLSPIDVTFTSSLDASQTFDAESFVQVGSNIIPNPDQNVFLLPLVYPSGDGLLQAQADIDGDGAAESVEVPSFAKAATYQTAVATSDLATLSAMAVPATRAELISLDGGQNNVIRISPLQPLMEKTKYLVVIAGPILDANGNAVKPNSAYETIRNPESNLAGINPALVPLRPAVRGWEQLAMGYFGFMQAVFDAAGVGASAPAYDDILMTLTFTTTVADDVLMSAAAPETFFMQSLADSYKKAAIANLVSGTYNLSGDNSGLSTVNDAAINSTINFLLTSATLPGDTPNPLYNAEIAGAIGAGAGYATIAESATAAFIMQKAAAEAAYQVHNSGDQAQGDIAPYVSIAAEAAGTVMAIDAGVGLPFNTLFPAPAPRAARFFRVDAASTINPALAAPAGVYQGEITLPIYQSLPGETGAEILTSRWQASPYIGAAIDSARGVEGQTPPSSMVTYRYPFPTKQADVTVPLLAVMPDETTLAMFGITKPADGWPVVIYQHGITTDRSIVLPIADALAFSCVLPDLSGPSGAPCFATIAIDQPLHGVTPSGSLVPGLFSVTDPDNVIEANLPLGDPVSPSESLTERHYDFTANASLQPTAMDYGAEFGDSGSLFINLTNFTNTRDTLRQLSLDLANLNASIDSLDVNADGLADDLDPNNVYFIGHSLGGINGIPFLAVNNSDEVQNSAFSAQPKVKAAVLMKTGGGVARLLTNSVSRAPQIMQGLAAANAELAQGRSGLESYLNVFQGIIDPADPTNFASSLSDANSDTGILLTEIVGDGSAESPADTVIPNAADTRWGADKGPLQVTLDNGFVIGGLPAPFAGTEPLLAQFGAVKTADASSDGDAAVLVTRFTEGSHGTPVVAGNTDADPYTSGAVFTEMLSEIVTFFALDGDVPGSIVANPEVVED